MIENTPDIPGRPLEILKFVELCLYWKYTVLESAVVTFESAVVFACGKYRARDVIFNILSGERGCAKLFYLRGSQ